MQEKAGAKSPRHKEGGVGELTKQYQEICDPGVHTDRHGEGGTGRASGGCRKRGWRLMCRGNRVANTNSEKLVGAKKKSGWERLDENSTAGARDGKG